MKTCHMPKPRRVFPRKQPKPDSNPNNLADPKAKDKVREKESQKQDLANLFGDFLKTGDQSKIIGYLISNSNLPGPRGNLELAGVFAEVVEEHLVKAPGRLWTLCQELTEYSPDDAPTNDPKEFLPFCGSLATGAIGSVSPTYFQQAMSRLRELAEDPRWRMRESVAMGIQRLMEKQSQKTLKELETWIVKDKWLAMRAVAAGVAEPALLKNQHTATSALKLHEKIFARILAAKDRKSDAFKTMKQGLGYSLSVVVRETPSEGFPYIRQLVKTQDTDILWITKENLKKNRLVKSFPDEVSSIKILLK